MPADERDKFLLRIAFGIQLLGIVDGAMFTLADQGRFGRLPFALELAIWTDMLIVLCSMFLCPIAALMIVATAGHRSPGFKLLVVIASVLFSALQVVVLLPTVQ